MFLTIYLTKIMKLTLQMRHHQMLIQHSYSTFNLTRTHTQRYHMTAFARHTHWYTHTHTLIYIINTYIVVQNDDNPIN